MKLLLAITIVVLLGHCCVTRHTVHDDTQPRIRKTRSLSNRLSRIGGAVTLFSSGLGSGQSGSNTNLFHNPNVQEWAERCMSGNTSGPPPVPTAGSTNLFSRSGRRRTVYSLSGNHNENRDYIFLIDTSGSVSGDSFEKAKHSVAKLFSRFCPLEMGATASGTKTKEVAVVLFGTTSETVLSFSESRRLGIDEVKNRILGLQHRRDGSTATADALRFVKHEVIPTRDASRTASLDVIVVTDGQCNSNCESDRLSEESAELNRHADVLAFGVDNYRRCELDIISAFSPKVTELEDFDEFSTFAEEFKNKALQRRPQCF